MEFFLMVMLISLTPFTTASNSEGCLSGSNRLDWFADQRYGMFIHWGPSVIHGGKYAYTDLSWSRGGTPPDPWCGGGPIPEQVYDDSYLSFNPTDYDPKTWVKLAQEAGMRYVVITARHHDSFSMFDTQQSDFKITNPQGAYYQWMTRRHPDWTSEQVNQKVDIVRQLAGTVHAAGLGFGIYYSEPDWIREDYRIGLTGKNKAGQMVSPTQREAAIHSYQNFMHAQLEELVTRYGKIDILWLDAIKPSHVQENGWDAIWIRQNTLAMVRRHQPGILVNDRHGFEPDYRTPENSDSRYVPGVVQESCQHVGKQWSWLPDDRVPSAKWIIDRIVLNASRNSNILMNMGPSPEGTFDSKQSERLREVGDWLRRHGEAVYGTRVGPVADNREDPPFVTTRKGNRVYVHVLHATLAGREIGIPGLTVFSAVRFDEPNQKLAFRNERGTGYVHLSETIDPLDEIVIIEGTWKDVDVFIVGQ